MTSAWLAFWNGSHSIYVSARHKDVHYRLIAKAMAALVPRPHARVLDYGCGEALHADAVAAAAGELLLCEAAPRVRAGLAARFANDPKIRAVAPEEVERLPDHSLDLVVLHSVAQYLKPEETAALFALFHRLLKSDGLLVVSDVLSPHVGAATDAAALLRFAAANGFFIAAVAGLARTLLSDYWRLRSRLGLTRYSEAAMLDKLGAVGFTAQRMDKNIGHNQARAAYSRVRAEAPRSGETLDRADYASPSRPTCYIPGLSSGCYAHRQSGKCSEYALGIPVLVSAVYGRTCQRG